MTTLRREIRKNIEKILNHWYGEQISTNDGWVFSSVVAEEIADALNSNNPNFFSEEPLKPKIDLAQSDPAWALFHGEDVTQEFQDAKKLEKEAFDTFERDMRVGDRWSWYPARTSEDKAWKILREHVVKVYAENKKCFQAYQTWRTQPYARGAMSNLAIKKNPENFPVSWTDFLAASPAALKPAEKVDDDNDDFEFKNEIYI